jgi:hypothetical protein
VKVPQEAMRQPVGTNERQTRGGVDGAMCGSNTSRGGGVDKRTRGRGGANRWDVKTSQLQGAGHRQRSQHWHHLHYWRKRDFPSKSAANHAYYRGEGERTW